MNILILDCHKPMSWFGLALVVLGGLTPVVLMTSSIKSRHNPIPRVPEAAGVGCPSGIVALSGENLPRGVRISGNFSGSGHTILHRGEQPDDFSPEVEAAFAQLEAVAKERALNEIAQQNALNKKYVLQTLKKLTSTFTKINDDLYLELPRQGQQDGYQFRSRPMIDPRDGSWMHSNAPAPGLSEDDPRCWDIIFVGFDHSIVILMWEGLKAAVVPFSRIRKAFQTMVVHESLMKYRRENAKKHEA